MFNKLVKENRNAMVEIILDSIEGGNSVVLNRYADYVMEEFAIYCEDEASNFATERITNCDELKEAIADFVRWNTEFLLEEFNSAECAWY